DDRWLAVSTLSFDIAGIDLFLPLLRGASVILAPRETASDAAQLSALIERSEATVMQATPVTWQLLVNGGGAGLERLVAWTGGEALSPALAAALRGKVRALWNLYGPTEATVYATGVRVDIADGGPVTIGRPVGNTRVLLLGRSAEMVPLGAAGELCIGGAGVARGYLNRPELTAERFVPDPLGAPGSRLYRTGDLARFRPDGRIEYLGRLDQQIKLRGFRIEPGEIEAALLAHPAVRAAVVMVGGGGLVAYVERAQVSAGDLRQFLASLLPDYMVPGSYVFLGSLPLTVSGKVDRKALAALRQERVESEGEGGPRTPAEELVGGIFAEVLGVERVGAAEDFFALGGHSLLATQVVSRVRAVFGVEMPVRTVFEAPTVTALARRIAGQEAQHGPAIPRLRRGAPLPLSFAQQRLWFLDQLEPGSAVYNIPVAIEATGRLDVSVLDAALAVVVRRHEALRTVFRQSLQTGEPVQVIAQTGGKLPVIDLAALPDSARDAEADRLAAAEARRPFDLSGLNGEALLRTAVLRRTPERFTVLVSMHHIVSDGWSLGVFVRELGALYAAFVEGRPNPLPELAVQPADLAAWQRRQLSAERLAPELAWWRAQLAGMPQALDLIPDHPRPAALRTRGG